MLMSREEESIEKACMSATWAVMPGCTRVCELLVQERRNYDDSDVSCALCELLVQAVAGGSPLSTLTRHVMPCCPRACELLVQEGRNFDDSDEGCARVCKLLVCFRCHLQLPAPGACNCTRSKA